MESSTVGGAKSSALNGRSRTFSNSAKGASQDANNTPNAGGGAIPSSRGCTPQRTNTILESLDLSVITASGSRDQAAALFGRLLRAAESSLAMLEANQTSQDEHIEPSTLQTFTKQASDWLQQAPQWLHRTDSGDARIDHHSPLQVSQVLQRIHELWQYATTTSAGSDAQPMSSSNSSDEYEDLGATSSDEAAPPIDEPPKLAYSHGRLMLTNSTKTLADLGHMASDVAHEMKEIFTQEAGLLAHEAQLFKDALSAGAERLLHFSELPHRWKNNKYIHKGYRFVPATRERFAGLVAGGFFSWHNESINIWTHTLGFFFCIYLIITDLPNHPTESTADWLVAASFLLSAAACLLLSTIWHVMAGCATWHLFNSSACLDYCGVSALISTSVLTTIWYGFYCQPQYVHLYSSTVIATGVLGVFLPFAEWFNKRENKVWRIAFFLSMCATALGPQVHMMCTQGFKETCLFFSGAWTSVGAYVVGLLFYGFNIPEVFRPGGMFDYVLHSHQVWHVAIIVAIYIQWAALKAMHERGTTSFSCGPPEPSLLDEISHMLHVAH